MHFNAGPDDWLVDGRRLKPASAATGVLGHSFSVEDGIATVGYELAVGEDPKLARAICKLALGLLAKREGHAAALDPKYDAVRRFVREDEGDFSFLILGGHGRDEHSFWRFYRGPNGEGPVIPITLFGLEMAVDLEEGQGPGHFPSAVHWNRGTFRQTGEFGGLGSGPRIRRFTDPNRP